MVTIFPSNADLVSEESLRHSASPKHHIHPSKCSRKSQCPPNTHRALSRSSPLTIHSISPGAKSKVKSSVQRAIRTKIIETYHLLTPHIDEINPKESELDLLLLFVPSLPFPSSVPLPSLSPFAPQEPHNLTTLSPQPHRPDRTSLYALDNQPLFFQHMDDPTTPHLSIIHAFPAVFPRIRIDRGAIRFMLSCTTFIAP